MDRAGWPSMKQRFAGIFRSRTREEVDARVCRQRRLRDTRAVTRRSRQPPAFAGARRLPGPLRGRTSGPGAALLEIANPRCRIRHRSRASTRNRCCARSGSRPERSTTFARAAPWHSSCDWRAAVLAHGPISSPPSTIIVSPVT
jgi:hypothetical protein